MDKALTIIYFVSFLCFFIMSLKILMETNIHKIFKQGKILEIRLFYLLISIIMSTIISIGLVKFIESITKIINF